MEKITIPTSAFDSIKVKVAKKDFDTDKHAVLYVKICEEMEQIATKNGIYFADTVLGVLEYDGKCWRIVDKRTATNKLGEIAELMGISPTTSKQFRFREDLMRQFAVSFFRELMPPDPSNVKINLNNGTLNVSTNEIAEHNPKDMFMYVLPFEYDPTARCPQFLKFLEEVLPDEDARQVIQEYVGYLFVFGLKLEKFLTLYGAGSNGKSVLLDVLSALLGAENVCNIPLQSICKENSPYVPKLAGKLANICNDVSNRIEDFSILKRIASGEPITGKALYKDPIEITVYAKLLFALNELPTTNDHSTGYWRRHLIVPFDVEITPDRQDKLLAKRIIDNELAGVLNWALEGLHRILETKTFSECKSADKQLKAYQREQDNVSQFVEEIELSPGQDDKRAFKELYTQYQTYCKENGYRPCNKGNFKNRMLKLGFDVRAAAGNVMYVFYKRDGEKEDNMPF